MTLANKLTTARMIAIIPILVLLCLDFAWCAPVAAILFVAAAITDILDGRIARKTNTVTDFGKIFDPAADKLLVLSTLLPLAASGRLHWLCVFVIVGRELVISAFRTVAASHNRVIAAGSWGKWKTTVTDIALIMMLVEGVLPFLKEWYISDIVMGAAVILTIVSMADYLIRNPLTEKNGR